MLSSGNDKPRRDSIGHASGLAVDCWDWPVAYPQTAMSVLFLLQQRNWRSNLDAIVSRSRGWPRSGPSHLTKC